MIEIALLIVGAMVMIQVICICIFVAIERPLSFILIIGGILFSVYHIMGAIAS